MPFPGRPLLLGALLAAFLTGTAASAAPSSKLDARILARRAAAARGYSPAGAGAAGSGAKESVLIRVSPGVTLSALRAAFPAAQFGSQSGDVVTARADDAALDALSADGRVEAVEAGVRAHPFMDAVRSSASSAGLALGTIYGAAATDLAAATGSGVIIGVVDTGIDYQHLDFVNDGPNTSRILSIWDQTISSHAGGPFPSGYAYGAEYSNAQLTTKLQGGGGTINTKDSDGHGTHVASIAAGDGTATNGAIPAGTFKGMAPAADIVFVRTTFGTADVVDGVNYIIAKAAAAGKRAVINLSLGLQAGPHDGTSTFESSIGAAAATTPIVVAMGNDGAAKPHAAGVVGPNGSAGFVVSVDGATADAHIEFWHPGADAYTAVVTLSGVGGSATAVAGGSASTSLGAHFVTISNGQNVGHPSGDKKILVTVNLPTGITASQISVTLTRTTNGGSGRVDGWVDPAGELISFASFVDNTMTLGEPACAPNVFGVASYASKKYWSAIDGFTYNFTSQSTLGNLSAFSSQGPTRDGRQQPDVAAPGDVIAAALSSDPAANPGQTLILTDNRHRILRGTSMAAPVVAGILAARLQAGPTRTVSQLRDILRGQARSDGAVGLLPNYSFGYGKVASSPQPVSAPTGLSAATMGASSVTWSWGAVTGADSYSLYYSTNPSVLLASGLQPPYIHTGLAANTTTGVLVKGVGGGVSGPGAFISTSTLAAPPAGLPTAVPHIDSVTVSWTVCPAAPAASSCWGYSVTASTAADGSGTQTVALTTNRATASLDVTGLSPLTTYYFRLATLNYYGAPSSTGPVSAATITDLLAPISPQFSEATTSSIRFDWVASGNPPGLTYAADASTSAAFAGTLFSSSTKNSYAVISGLSVNTSYYFRVRATGGPYLIPGTAASTLALEPAASTAPFSGVSLTGFTVFWSSGGNPPGTQYVAEISASASFSGLAGSSVTRNGFAAFTGLTANTLYYARALALSHGGVATAYAALGSTPTFVIAPTLPAEPFSARTSDGFTFTFVPGANPGGTAYHVRVSTDPGFFPLAGGATTTGASASFTGLKSNQRYYADVAALNVAGTPTAYTGAVSTATSVVAPGAPASPVTARASSSLSTSWTTSTLAAGTQFLSQASALADFSVVAGASTTANAFATVAGLPANTAHYLRVRALSQNPGTADGPWTAIGSASTLANAPSAAASPFPLVGVASVTVAWTALPLAPPASACEGYLVELSSSASFGSIAASSSVAPGAASANLSGLSYGTTYWARVGSLNWDGSPNYLSVGSTRTARPVLSSGTVTGAPLTLTLSPFNVIPSVSAEFEPGTFPAGTVVTMLSGVTQDLSNPRSGVASLTALGNAVGFDISAAGLQPARPVRLVVSFDPLFIPGGADPRRLLIARYDEASAQWVPVPSAVDLPGRRVIATLDHFSSYAPFLGTAGGGVGDGIVFPQPWEAGSPDGSYAAQALTFANFPAFSRIRVVSLTGELVWDGTAAANGMLSWDGRNKSGRPVASGVYYATIEAGGARKVRRVAVIR